MNRAILRKNSGGAFAETSLTDSDHVSSVPGTGVWFRTELNFLCLQVNILIYYFNPAYTHLICRVR